MIVLNSWTGLLSHGSESNNDVIYLKCTNNTAFMEVKEPLAKFLCSDDMTVAVLQAHTQPLVLQYNLHHPLETCDMQRTSQLPNAEQGLFQEGTNDGFRE